MNVCMTSNIYGVLKRFYETSTSNEVSCFQCNWHCVVWIINKYKTSIWSLFYLVKLTFSNQITPMLKLGTASPKWKRAKNLPERSGKSLRTHLFYPSWFFLFYWFFGVALRPIHLDVDYIFSLQTRFEHQGPWKMSMEG